MIKITFDLSDGKDCERILKILEPETPILEGHHSIDELVITPHLRLNLLDRGFKTIEQLESATDKELLTVRLIGRWRLREIREEIKYWRTNNG